MSVFSGFSRYRVLKSQKTLDRSRRMAEMGDNAFRDDDGEVKGKLVCQIARETSKKYVF